MSAVRIAILGNPSQPDVEWSSENLRWLAAAGFTAVQLNIAWSYRPGDEALNLEDVALVPGSPEPLSASGPDSLARRRSELRARSAAAKAAGLRTLFHFGAPFQGRVGFEGGVLPQCIRDPATGERYADAIRRFGADFPDVDDLLVYTYDQDAWLCSEFDGCERCAGIPLHDRLPPFLSALARAWGAVRPSGRVWWEPWELSAGQTLAVIPHLDPAMGLMLHSSIGEVVSTIAGDRFVRNAAALARERSIPVVAEVFLSSANEEVEPFRRLPVPLVTLRQLRDVERVRGVVGVKEYFGVVPTRFDVNMAAAAAYFEDPLIPEAAALESIAAGWDAPWLVEFWTRASTAYELYPWDSSWFARQLGRSQPSHELSAATVRGAQSKASEWDTPAWRSTRGSTFMRLTNEEPHPWLLEDVGLRFATAAAEMETALAAFDRWFVDRGDEASAELRTQRSEAEAFVTRADAYAHHVRSTNLAALIRASPERRADLAVELRGVMQADRDNQLRELARRSAATLAQAPPRPLQVAERWVVPDRVDTADIDAALALLEQDLDAFLERYFLPGPDAARAGQFSLTSR
ncbi:hypothetical protein HF576_05155 [Microbacterium sp. CFH 90308]|uniref:Uncharacterized protein n=1 Tax=Microbacterium salsuginis TaxID=2722803 RepID=A0ABX1KCT9_9MICO|nr:hypothetical protein [Microbacterium sp. CFH 90308]NLP83226.1 hypothetical protein [Microbacterium sp. CFH 90308]